MSSIEPGDQFVSEDALRSMLERWTAPEPSRSLDQRVSNSYHRELLNAGVGAEPVPLPLRQKEVVTMKFCSTCQEEFADKFSFCPVDGNPLTTVAVKDEDPSLTVSREASHEESEPWVQSNGSYSTTP